MFSQRQDISYKNLKVLSSKNLPNKIHSYNLSVKIFETIIVWNNFVTVQKEVANPFNAQSH